MLWLLSLLPGASAQTNQNISVARLAQANQQFDFFLPTRLRANAAQDILNFYLNDNQLAKIKEHGCWCAKILNYDDITAPRRGGTTEVDDLDLICKQWQTQINCVHTLGGSCENIGAGDDEVLANIYIETNGDGIADLTECGPPAVNNDACSEDVCVIHNHFAKAIAEWIDQNRGYPQVVTDDDFCLGDPHLLRKLMCVGNAPELRFETLVFECSDGVPAEGYYCTGLGDEKCVSCDEGFELDANNHCNPPAGGEFTENGTFDHEIRLSFTTYGIVMVWKDDQWNTICDDAWSSRPQNDDIICQQLFGVNAIDGEGHSGSSPPYYYTDLLQPESDRNRIIWDDVTCTGNEATIYECSRRADYSHNCSRPEDVWVVCEGANVDPANERSVVAASEEVEPVKEDGIN